jgi:ribonuclease P protein component
LSCSDADLLPPDIRLGIVTGKRVGSSVVRNRVKRILREIGRRALREALEPRDFVIIARAPIVGHSSGEIERALRDLLRRAALL